MDSLIASYGQSSGESYSESSTQPTKQESRSDLHIPLPPAPLSLINPPNPLGSMDYSLVGQPSRVRTFPHVKGNYALHVYIPVYAPPGPKKEMAMFMKRVGRVVPGLHVVGADVPLGVLCEDDAELERVALGREFHISLSRTVPIRAYQINSVVTMLRQKVQHRRQYRIDFSKWEVFVNDDRTRTFLSIEVTAAGLAEIRKQIQIVNEVYRLHNLPEFYEDPRPHISIAWALGDVSNLMKYGVQQERRFVVGDSLQKPKSLFSCKFGGVDCKIGKKIHKICTITDR